MDDADVPTPDPRGLTMIITAIARFLLNHFPKVP
jgi:hypothetical protein